jgi:short-chain fatty acids transporter
MADHRLEDDRLARFARALGRIIPDAMSTCIVMMVLVFAAALLLGNSLATVGDAYYRGLWMLVPFTMQMTLILVLSSTLGAAPAFKRIVARVATLPRSEAQVFLGAVLVTASFAYLYWGLGLALGPLIAIYFAREAERKAIPVDFPFLLAVTAASTSVWQFGLSSSAPLLMNTPGHFLEQTTGLMPLSTTIWAPSSLTFIAVFVVALVIAARFLKPARPQPISDFPESWKLAEPMTQAMAEPITRPVSPAEPVSERLERNSIPTLLLAVALLGWLGYHFGVKGAGLELNALNTILLLVTLLVHRNVRNFSTALQSAILSCWPVVVLYHLYAGVAGLIQFTTVGEQFASGFAAISTRATFPLLTALAATVVSIFVPSSGGQWVIQGFVTAKAAEAVGVTVQRGLLSLSVGDQMGNLVTPFWAVISAGMARIDFRRFIGYTVAFSALWFVLGVIVFTVMPD